MATDADVSSLTYEAALAELEQLITRLERGDVDLDEAVACYQRGSALAQRCATLLDRTEASVMQLVVGARGIDEERPFTPLPGDDDAPAQGRARSSDHERPVAPPPPGSPARARAVPVTGRGVAATAPERPSPPRPAPERPEPPRPAPPPRSPELFPGLEPAPGAGEAEGDFDLDDIPF